MAITLARGETILFPMPYVEAERPPYVVTNQRLIEQVERGQRVLEVRQIVAANRAKSRPYATVGALLLCIALGTLAAGAYFSLSVLGMPAAPMKALFSQEGSEPESDNDPAPSEPAHAVDLPDDPSVERPDADAVEVLKTRLLGMGLLALGIGLGSVGLRVFRKRRYFVVCRTQDAMMRIRVDGKVQQDLILATLQAVR